MFKKIAAIVIFSLAFSSLFWWSHAFFWMSQGYEYTFREPRPYVAFAEFILTGSAALALSWKTIKEIKSK